MEQYDDLNDAIRFEKSVKRWKRVWKLALIEKNNQTWRDLYGDYLLPRALSSDAFSFVNLSSRDRGAIPGPRSEETPVLVALGPGSPFGRPGLEILRWSGLGGELRSG